MFTWVSSRKLGWVPISSTVLLALLQGCADLKPNNATEPPLEVSKEPLTETYTLVFQDGTNGYAGTRDTYLSERYGNKNYGATTVLYVDGDTSNTKWRELSALLYFDISSIPKSATVTAATLSLFVTDATTTSYPIYGLNRSWNEFQSTWLRPLNGQQWQSSGAKGTFDRDPSPLAVFATNSTGNNTTELDSIGIAKLQKWVSNPESNFGFMIASPTNSDELAFHSHEIASVVQRPKLVVTYTVTTQECIAPDCCTSNSVCSDGNLCTSDTCVNGTCENNKVADCCNSPDDCADDSNPCTTQTCEGNICFYPTIEGCCLIDSECADSNECSTDTCDKNTCKHATIATCCNNHIDCNDGNNCTSDTCTNHACSNASISGCCLNDSECSDGNLCTAEVCVNNSCIVSEIPGCCIVDSDCDDNDACTSDNCIANQCDYAIVPGCCTKDTDCPNGDLCTQTSCINHECKFSTIAGCCRSDSECGDADPCTLDQCVDGACIYSLIAGGACGCNVDLDCDDARNCTTDTCIRQVCQNVETYPGACGCQSDEACDDGNPCTKDISSNMACNHTPLSCADGNPATVDECVNGYCQHAVNVPITKTFRNGENSYNGAVDTKIAQYYPSTNYGTDTVLVVDGDEPNGGGNDVSTLIRWNNIGIPTNATVTQASITISIGGGTNAASASAYSIYSLNRPWVDFETTWDNADSTQTWSTSGANGALDRDTIALGSTDRKSVV